jgi:lysophospholipase L1-like esterase
MTDNGGGDTVTSPTSLTQTRPTRVCRVTVLLAVLALTVTACSGDSEPAGRVAIIGDSTTNRALEQIEDAVNGTLDVRALPGVLVQDMQGQAAQLALQPTDHLVINLGTNDSLLGATPAVSAAGIFAMVGLFTITTGCVHLVTVSEHMQSHAGSDAPAVAATINKHLRATAADWGYRIVDWNAIVEERMAAGDEVTVDTIHSTPEGAALLADAIADSLSDC